MNTIVTIDGGVATGTSSVSKELALALQIPRIDSGSMYRGVTWLVIKEGVDAADEAACAQLAETADLFMPDGEVLAVNGTEVVKSVDGQRIDNLHIKAIDDLVPTVAGYLAVREAIDAQQRQFAEANGAVADGRDTGTVVFPEASLKLFLVCNDEEAARRRTIADGRVVTVEEIRARNEADRNHQHGALAKAPDAIEIDTTHIPQGEVVELALGLLDKPTAQRPQRISRPGKNGQLKREFA